MRGIKKLTVYSRKVVSGKDSKLDVRAPTLRQIFSDLAPGTPGVRGESGVAGPKGTGIKEKRNHIYYGGEGGGFWEGSHNFQGKRRETSRHQQSIGVGTKENSLPINCMYAIYQLILLPVVDREVRATRSTNRFLD